jgi:hypothetical protein
MFFFIIYLFIGKEKRARNPTSDKENESGEHEKGFR